MSEKKKLIAEEDAGKRERNFAARASCHRQRTKKVKSTPDFKISINCIHTSKRMPSRLNG
jgi:hypothetical protein